MKLKDIVRITFLTAISVVIGYFETYIPLPIPGVKLGLANIILLLAIYEEGISKSLFILLCRVLIVGLIRGTFMQPVFFMSLTGGLFAFISMSLLSKIKILSPIVVSVSGALMHVLGQIIIAYILISSSGVFYYLPFIALLSFATGIVSGIMVIAIRKRYIFLRNNH